MSELAVAAGFFEASGQIVTRNGKPHLQLRRVDRDLLLRFAAALGHGEDRVLGPYTNDVKSDRFPRSKVYVWTTRVGEPQEIIDLLWPWLSPHKRALALERGLSFPHENDDVVVATGSLRPGTALI